MLECFLPHNQTSMLLASYTYRLTLLDKKEHIMPSPSTLVFQPEHYLYTLPYPPACLPILFQSLYLLLYAVQVTLDSNIQVAYVVLQNLPIWYFNNPTKTYLYS